MPNFYLDFPTKDDFDTAYDVEARVPDVDRHLEEYVANSAVARETLECRLGVSYGPSVMENLDVFAPGCGNGGAPLVVFLHGGSWHALTASEFSFVALGLVGAGMGVANVTYGLCPDVGIAEIVRQTRAAVVWAYRNAEAIGCDPKRIILMGHSAGGHLAAMAALTDWSMFGLPTDTVKAVVPISGIFDLEPMALTSSQTHIRLSDTEIRWQSPMRILRRVDARCLTVWGGDELSGYVDQSRRFAAAWSEAGNCGETLVVAGKNHFDVMNELMSPSSDLVLATSRLARL